MSVAESAEAPEKLEITLAASPLYQEYFDLQKYVATYEYEFRKFPTPVLNEFRDFLWHIARIEIGIITGDKVNSEINEARGHLSRAKSDLFQLMCKTSGEKIAEFEHDYVQTFDIGKMDARFKTDYKKLKKDFNDKLKEANALRLENTSPSDALYKYVIASQAGLTLINTIETEKAEFLNTQVRKSKLRRRLRLALDIVLGLATIGSLLLAFNPSLAIFIRQLFT